MRYAALAAFIAATALAASFGATYKPGAWYDGLVKPWWTPPGIAFPVVWTLLYLMIAVAGWLVWAGRSTAPEAARWALALWCAQLLLNALWSYFMFGQHRIDMALADLILMWCAIAGFTLVARKISRPATLLFLPYLGWVSFAGALNAAILRLNP